MTCEAPAEESTDSLVGVPFSLASFKILSLIFVIFIVICLGVDLFGLILLWLFVLPGPECLFFHPQVWEVFSSIASSNFSDPSLSLSPPSGTSMMWMFICLMLCQKSLIIILFKCCLLFKILSFFSVQVGWFPLFCLPVARSISWYLFYLLLMPSNVFLFQLLYSSALFGSFYFLFVKLFTVFGHSSPVFIEHLYDCYLELHIK